MTDLSLDLSELEIIGYADRLSESFVPQIVPPIFRIRTESDCVVMPPFRIEGNRVTEAKVGLESDLDRAVIRGQATRLDETIVARPGYRLWIDETFLPHYESATDVAETLRELAHTKARKAQDALAQGRMKEAQRLAQAAISADDGCLNAILVKALVHRLEGDQEGVEILTEIAGIIVPGADFLAWIEFFSTLVAGRIVNERYALAEPRASNVAEPTIIYDASSLDSDWRGAGGWIEEDTQYSNDEIVGALVARYNALLEMINTRDSHRFSVI